ncbi:MAG: alpha/beta hydrolase [Halioglobus sp.]|nr:alpha/beta hydrolase [Halioglobus sp.]
MSVDFEPGIQAYIEKIRAVVALHPVPRNIEERRRNTDRVHSVWRRPAPDTIDVLNWWVGLPGREVPIRIYRQKGLKNPPVVIYLHGGGFVASSYDTHDTITWGLAEKTGAVVISVHYRRAPENPYPAATDDCFGVLEWIHRNADWLEADADRIAVVGDSAGGCLAAALTMQVRDSGGPPLRLQALLYPGVDPVKNRPSHLRAQDPMLRADMMDYFWDCYLPGQRHTTDPIAAPIRATDFSGLPPAYIAVGEYDPLHDESVEYARLLRAAGIPTEFHVVPRSIHGFLRARFVSPGASEAFESLALAIRRSLSLAPPPRSIAAS